jgi:hypothetical protein
MFKDCVRGQILTALLAFNFIFNFMNHCCQYGIIISRFLLYTQQILNFDFEPFSIFGYTFKQRLLCTFFNSCESYCNKLIKNLLADNLPMLLVASFSTLLFLCVKVKSLYDLIETIDFIVCDGVLSAYDL